MLSEPLTTTGALLPLLPALGFWVTSSEVHYSLLLLTIGVLYAAVSALRKSFWFAVLAALAANGSLWYLLHERDGLSITEHPQLWLIPPALCVLVAGYINRARLSRGAVGRTALRLGDRDLRLVDGRHLHQRRGRRAVAAGRARRACRSSACSPASCCACGRSCTSA